MIPKPRFPQPKPERLTRREVVTIVAAFQCIDGILMCADTEETISSETKAEGEKLRVFQMKNSWCLCGGAGDASVADLAMWRLHQDMIANHYGWNEIERVLNRHASEIFSKHIKPYSHFPDGPPEIAMLLAIAMEDRIQLYKWEKTFVRYIQPYQHEAIGIGILQAGTFLRAHNFSVTYKHMVFFAASIMQRVKRLVRGCGGKTDIFLLKRTGQRMGYKRDTVEFLEKFSDSLDDALLHFPIFFTTAQGTDSEDKVEEIFDDEIPKIFKALRKEYLETMTEVVKQESGDRN